ncbi:MAG: energy transducer TonB [Deltaproteobacteria bacterium]|nr:energy transducer TonB [Deltaproteobacteria bacterium]
MAKSSKHLESKITRRSICFIALAGLLHLLLIFFLSRQPKVIEVSLNLSELKTEIALLQLQEEKFKESRVEEEQAVEAPVLQKQSPIKKNKQQSTAPKQKASLKSSVVAEKNTAPMSAELSEEAIKKYLNKVIIKLERNKYYPRLAQENEEEGVLNLEITLDRSGNVKSYRFIKTTNYQRLNQAAEKTLKKAGSFGPLPASYAGDTLNLQVPIRFRLAS